MANIFIDCGAHNGSSVRKFKSLIHNAFEYKLFSFEANPVFFEEIEKTGTTLLKKAVWVENGKKDFFIVTKDKYNSEDMRTGASTLNQTKNEWNLKAHKETTSFEVDTVDFSSWLSNNFTKDDFIILKMDIEGSEYEVLNKMIEDDTISLINELWIEFHYKKCGVSEEQHKNLINKLKKIDLKLDQTWNSMGF